MNMQIGIPIQRKLGVLALLVFSAFGDVGVSTTAGKQAAPESVQPGRGPKPPCSNEVDPSYPALDEQVVTKPWSAAYLGRDWEPPTCLGWDSNGFTTLVTTVATFRFQAEEAESSTQFRSRLAMERLTVLVRNAQTMENIDYRRLCTLSTARRPTSCRFYGH